MATECTRDAVLGFLTERGGRVKRADLIDHFRSFISPDSEIKEAFEDSVAVVKVENGEEYVCLRSRFRGSVKRQDGHHDGPDTTSSTTTSTTSSTTSAAVLETSPIPPLVAHDNRSDDLLLLLLAPVKPGESQSHALNTKDAKPEIPPVPECAGAGTSTPPNISQTGPHRSSSSSSSSSSRAFTSPSPSPSGDKTQMGNQHPRTGGAGNISRSARRSDEALHDATGSRAPDMSLTQPRTGGSQVQRPQGLAARTGADRSHADSRSEGEEAPGARDEDEDRTGSGSVPVGIGACEGGAREGRTDSASNTPRGSRKSFLAHMMSRSPQLRRSVMHRYSRHAAAAKSDGDAGESRSLTCAHAEEESAAATLDPLEHEWMMCACDGEWDSLSRLLNRDPNLISKKDFVTGFTCLHWAAKLGKHELLAQVVNFARRRGVALDVNVRSSAGYTPLHLAAVHNHVEVIKLLVGACDADVEARDYSGKKASQYLRGDVARDVLDIAGADAARGPVIEELALGDEAARWKLPRVLQANLRLLNRSASEDDDRDCAARDRPLRRKTSLNKLKPRLSRTRAGIPPIVHSTSHFERLEGASGHTSGPVKSRPKSNLFG